MKVRQKGLTKISSGCQRLLRLFLQVQDGKVMKVRQRTSEPNADCIESMLLLEGLLGDEPLPEEEDATASHLKGLCIPRSIVSEYAMVGFT